MKFKFLIITALALVAVANAGSSSSSVTTCDYTKTDPNEDCDPGEVCRTQGPNEGTCQEPGRGGGGGGGGGSCSDNRDFRDIVNDCLDSERSGSSGLTCSECE